MIKTISQKIGKEWIAVIGWVWTWVLPCVILIVTGLKIMDSPEQLQSLKSVKAVEAYGLITALLLVPLNVLLEAVKWKVIIEPLEKKNIRECLKIILSGRSLNVISPLGMGDAFTKYAGTLAGLRAQTFAGIAMDRFSQLLPTMIIGLISLFFLVNHGLELSFNPSVYLMIAGFVALIGGVVYFIFQSNIKKYLQLVTTLNWRSAARIVGLSFARYAVFTAQFILIFKWLGSELPLDIMFLGIGWIFWVKTIIPSLSVLGDLVKREFSAVLFFSFFSAQMGEVILASFVIWLVNIVLPALVGIGFVHQFKKAF